VPVLGAAMGAASKAYGVCFYTPLTNRPYLPGLVSEAYAAVKVQAVNGFRDKYLPGRDLASIQNNPELLIGAARAERNLRASLVKYDVFLPEDPILKAINALRDLMQKMPADLQENLVTMLQAQNLMLFLARYKASPYYAMAGEMIQKLSHDFRALLAAIRTNLGLLLQRAVPEISDSRLHDVAKNLLEYSFRDCEALLAYLQSVEISYLCCAASRPTDLDLNQLIAERIKWFEALTHVEGITINFSSRAELRKVRADKIKLQAVLINMLLNAAQAIGANLIMKTGATGTITITAENVDEQGRAWVKIVIADTGKGIDPSITVKIFEPFFTTKGELGTGLGLPISRDMVAEFGGSLTIESDGIGRGAVVTILLPAGEK
jgi:signal transduction histidine kinase